MKAPPHELTALDDPSRALPECLEVARGCEGRQQRRSRLVDKNAVQPRGCVLEPHNSRHQLAREEGIGKAAPGVTVLGELGELPAVTLDLIGREEMDQVEHALIVLEFEGGLQKSEAVRHSMTIDRSASGALMLPGNGIAKSPAQEDPLTAADEAIVEEVVEFSPVNTPLASSAKDAGAGTETNGSAPSMLPIVPSSNSHFGALNGQQPP